MRGSWNRKTQIWVTFVILAIFSSCLKKASQEKTNMKRLLLEEGENPDATASIDPSPQPTANPESTTTPDPTPLLTQQPTPWPSETPKALPGRTPTEQLTELYGNPFTGTTEVRKVDPGFCLLYDFQVRGNSDNGRPLPRSDYSYNVEATAFMDSLRTSTMTCTEFHPTATNLCGFTGLDVPMQTHTIGDTHNWRHTC